MLRVGILGMGMMGWFHATRYAQLPNVKLVAIADSTPERLEAKEAVAGNMANAAGATDLAALARYTDAGALIADAQVDIIDICLPTFLHARYAVQALQAGRHVLVEKPMALTLEEADQMIAASRQANRFLMIAQCLRFWPEYLYLKRALRERPFGKLLSLNMFRMGGRPIWSWQNWFIDPARSGGTLWDLHIHDVDCVNYLLGRPDHIQAAACKSEATGYYDVVHTVYSYRDGPQVHMHAGWSMAQIPFNHGFDAWFERGFLRFDGKNDPPLLLFDDLVQVNGHAPEYEKGDAYANEIAYFARCVEQGQPPLECPPESARDSLALVKQEIAVAESVQAKGKG